MNLTTKADDPMFLDIVERIVTALTPLHPIATPKVIAAVDYLALAIMETLDVAG